MGQELKDPLGTRHTHTHTHKKEKKKSKVCYLSMHNPSR